jgi:hypothetical protein
MKKNGSTVIDPFFFIRTSLNYNESIPVTLSLFLKEEFIEKGNFDHGY